MLMISLIGEQSMPNLLPSRSLKPEKLLLIHTDRTVKVSERLSNMFARTDQLKTDQLKVDAYDVLKIEEDIHNALTSTDPQSMMFNLTGGTKAMSLAAYRLAEKFRAPFVYFQSEGKISKLYRYSWNSVQQPELENETDLPPLISIEDYITASTGNKPTINGPSRGEGGHFENAIFSQLSSIVDEIQLGVKFGGALDADLMVRLGNRVGVIEAKTGGKARSKEGIDQLNTIAGPDYLGTYTAKFLIINQKWGDRLNLRDLATARNITVIELPSYQDGTIQSDKEKQKLIDTIKSKL